MAYRPLPSRPEAPRGFLMPLLAWDGARTATAREGDRMDSRTVDVQVRQRLEALAHANRIRQARAELKRGIADGRVSAADVILFHPREVEGMPVADLLT